MEFFFLIIENNGGVAQDSLLATPAIEVQLIRL
jgi:hypothetical protein